MARTSVLFAEALKNTEIRVQCGGVNRHTGGSGGRPPGWHRRQDHGEADRMASKHTSPVFGRPVAA